MDDATQAILSSWNWRLPVMAMILAIGGLYTVGWLRLRRVRSAGQANVVLASAWRLASFWFGLVLVALALLSPIETLSSQLFSIHMVQHLLIGMFAPPLLMAPNPFPVVMWALPLGLRVKIGRTLFSQKSALRPLIKSALRPALVWFLFFVVLWGWHDANLYNLTLVNEWAHDFEHVTFYATAMLLWWHITGAGPRLHKGFSYPARIAFTLACVPANMILGVFIAMASKVIYTYYETVPFRIWNISVLDDQALGGAIMWVPGSMMYVIAVVVLLGRWLSLEEKKGSRAR